MRKRLFIEELFAKALMAFSTFVVFVFVFSIVSTIIKYGWHALSWELVSQLPTGGFYLGKGGGFLNAIVGSLYIVGASTILGLTISIPIVFFLNVYLTPQSKFGYAARLAFDILFGVPSIVYGAFAFSIMIYLGMKASLLGGIVVVTLLIIPIFIRTMDETARNFPRDLLDATYSLGATRWETLWIIVRQIAPGIATATLLSIGRAIGDAAGVMLTTGFNDSIPTSLSDQTASLPLTVFFLWQTPSRTVQERAYAAALVLTLIVLALSILGRLISNKFSKNKL
jgi:phosphate transport system permease protein